MTRHDDTVRMRHMLDLPREAAALIRDRKRDDLDSDRILNLALVRLMEIIGEAASRVSEESRKRHTSIAWSQIVSLRHRLIHGYDSVDMDILWRILQEDMPSLIKELERAVPSQGD